MREHATNERPRQEPRFKIARPLLARRRDYRGGRGGDGALSGAWYSQKFSAVRQTPPFRSHSAALLIAGDAAEPSYEVDVQALIDAMTPMTTSGTNHCFMAALPPNPAYTSPGSAARARIIPVPCISWPMAMAAAKSMIATVNDGDAEALKLAAFLAWVVLNDVLSDRRLQLSAARRAQLETSYAQLTNALLRLDPSLVA